MSMFEALKKYAVFSGRATRTEFWLFSLLFYILVTVATYITVIQVSTLILSTNASSPISVILSVIFLLLMLVLLGLIIPLIAVGVRRLHDIDKSGWWLLISFVPFGHFVLLAFFCMDGTEGKNRFGSDPKGRKKTSGKPRPFIQIG